MRNEYPSFFFLPTAPSAPEESWLLESVALASHRVPTCTFCLFLGGPGGHLFQSSLSSALTLWMFVSWWLCGGCLWGLAGADAEFSSPLPFLWNVVSGSGESPWGKLPPLLSRIFQRSHWAIWEKWRLDLEDRHFHILFTYPHNNV